MKGNEPQHKTRLLILQSSVIQVEHSSKTTRDSSPIIEIMKYRFSHLEIEFVLRSLQESRREE